MRMTGGMPILAVFFVGSLGCAGDPAPSGKDSGDDCCGTGGADDPADGSGDGTADGGPVDPCATKRVEVGTGASAFEPFGDPAAAIMVHGPQGGWHMLGSLRTTGLQQVVSVVYTITDLGSGVEISRNNYRVGTIFDAETCVGTYPGMYGYLLITPLVDGERDTPPELLSWAPLQLCMSADDGEDSAEACVELTAEPDPIDVASGLAPPRPE